jgi:histidine triad (HIT) family protein
MSIKNFMCIFCKIINKEIPCYKVYEDEKTLAFLDIKPVNPGHTIVIPKEHYQNIEDISAEDFIAVMMTVKKIGKLLKDKLGVIGYNVHENNDLVAGQEVPHLHFHIIPRTAEDGLEHWPGGKYKDGEAEEIIKKLGN